MCLVAFYGHRKSARYLQFEKIRKCPPFKLKHLMLMFSGQPTIFIEFWFGRMDLPSADFFCVCARVRGGCFPLLSVRFSVILLDSIASAAAGGRGKRSHKGSNCPRRGPLRVLSTTNQQQPTTTNNQQQTTLNCRFFFRIFGSGVAPCCVGFL